MERRYVFLVGLVLGAGALLANLPGAAGENAPYCLFRALLWLCALHVLCSAYGLRVRRRSERTVTAALAVVALFALAAHVDFGRMHGGGRALHHHELFNYYMGSKYFPELGYDGHYLATHRALVENDPSLHEEIEVVKNLRTYQMESRSVSLQRSESVAARFTAARWQEFRDDVARFETVVPRATWPFLVVDHGYNATPFWTLLGRTFSTRLSPGTGALRFLASLDVALLAAALALAAWGFGRRVALLFAVFYLATFFGTFEFTGGAFLRQVWFLGLVGFAACWHRDRPVAAGLFLAVAALDRVFPILLAAVPAVLLAREAWVHRALRRDAARLLAACAAGVLVLGLASGTSVWIDCWDNLTAHSRWFFLNQISLRTLFIVDPASTLAMLRAGWDDAIWLRERQGLDAATQGTLLALRAVLAGLVLLRCARRADAFAGLGLAALLPFILLYPANYYFTLCAVPLLCLAHDRPLALAVVGQQAAFWILQALLPPPVDLELLNWAVSLILLATLLAFLGGDLARALRGAGRRGATVALALSALALAAGVSWDVARHRLRPDAVELDLVATDLSVGGGASTNNQSMEEWGNAWSRNDHVSVVSTAPGARADIAFAVPADGRYDLRLELTAARPFSEVACALDGGAPFATADLYAPQLAARAVVAPDLLLAAGRHALELSVTDAGSAAGRFCFAIDRVLLEPALARTPAAARERALSWMRAHPADLFDGGRKDLCAELIALERLRDAPELAAHRGELEALARGRLSALNACRGDFALPPEAVLLAAAGCAAERLGGALALLSVARDDVLEETRLSYGESSVVPPCAVRAWVARLDGVEPGPAAGGPAPLLFALQAEAADPARENRLAADLALEVEALTDLGRAPARDLPLSPAQYTTLLDIGLRRALDRRDVLTAARLLLAASSLDLGAAVPSYAAGIRFLLEQQEPSGSFGRADPQAPNPEREAVLTALLVLSAA